MCFDTSPKGIVTRSKSKSEANRLLQSERVLDLSDIQETDCNLVTDGIVELGNTVDGGNIIENEPSERKVLLRFRIITII